MIPIRDTIPSKNYPVVNTALIIVNFFVFFIQISQGTGQEQFVYTYGLVPARYSVPFISSHFTFFQQVFALLSFMFLHGGLMHIIGNMWFLYIFGDNVEDRMGSFYYLIFYLLCGLMSGLFHLATNFHSTMPTIGASGAIAGVMGAYFLLYPHSKILTLIPIIIIPWFVELPAVFFLGFWFLMQVLSAASSHAMAGGIAWWAHVGGFIVGMAGVKFFNVLPDPGFASGSTSDFFQRKRSPRLHVIKSTGSRQDGNVYEEINITPYEAAAGTTKTINIPWGFYNRFYKVAIPANTRDGMVLRLRGAGYSMENGHRGDLLLRVRIQQPWQNE